MMHGPAAPATPGPPIVAGPGPEAAALRAAVKRLKHGTVLVVGDAMLDRYVYGTVARISPEAPVPVLAVEREVALPGGAGNVVRNLTALGAPVAFVSVVGDDQAGSDLTGLVGGQPGVEPWLLVQGGRATTTKTRFVAAGQQMMRVDHEQVAPIHPRLAERMVRIAADAVAATGVMILSDYQKGVLAGDVPARLIAAARSAGRRVLVDPKGGDHGRYAGADLIVPDREELAAATGLPVDSPAEVAAAARALRAAHGFGGVLVVLGEQGVALVQPEADGSDSVQLLPPETVEVIDASGAADAVVAVAAAGLSANLPLDQIARLAALAAGIVMGKTGIAPVREEELLAALEPGRLVARKLVARHAAVEQVERWRRRGHRVGLTSGSFDPADASRLALLRQARSWCDRLLVAVEGEAEAAALAALPMVDLVTTLAGETALELIRAVRPDVLVQDGGGINGDLLQEWGGELRVPQPEPEIVV